MLHEIAEIGIFTHIAHLHDGSRLTLYSGQLEGVGRAKLSGSCRGSIWSIQIFKRTANARTQVSIIKTP